VDLRVIEGALSEKYDSPGRMNALLGGARDYSGTSLVEAPKVLACPRRCGTPRAARND